MPSLAIGGEGIVSVAAHLCGRELKEIAKRTNAVTSRGRPQSIWHEPLFGALFATTSPIPVKWAMRELGFAVGDCRSPMGAMPEAAAATLGALLAPYRERAVAVA